MINFGYHSSVIIINITGTILCISSVVSLPSLQRYRYKDSYSSVQLSSVAQSSTTLRLQHARLPYLSPSPGACSNSCPLSWWCYLAISSSVITFSSCLQSFPASEAFLMSRLFASGGQNIGASVSASVLPMNIQGWFPLGLTGLISLQSKGFSSLLQHRS